jgi:hypothetical protein
MSTANEVQLYENRRVIKANRDSSRGLLTFSIRQILQYNYIILGFLEGY